jgi:hypothetical protein
MSLKWNIETHHRTQEGHTKQNFSEVVYIEEMKIHFDPIYVATL